MSRILLWCFAEIRLEKVEVHKLTQLFHSESERRETPSAHLDPTDSLLGLHHAHILRRGLVWQQLCRAQIVCSKNDAVDEVLWVTRAWNWDARKGKIPRVSLNRALHTVIKENIMITHFRGAHFISVCVCVYGQTHLPHTLGMMQCSSSTAISRTKKQQQLKTSRNCHPNFF